MTDNHIESTASPRNCAACGYLLSGTALYEDGIAYHYGCRPSRRTMTEQRLYKRIAELEHDNRNLHGVADDLRATNAEMDDELKTATRLNGQWMDERTEAIIERDKALAELAQERKAHAHDEQRADRHFAELAALKGRRCETCERCDAPCWILVAYRSGMGDPPSKAPFCCIRWQARTEEGRE